MISSEPNPNASLDEWISDLPKYQQRSLLTLEQDSGDEFEVFDKWLDSLAVDNFVGYGSKSDRAELTSAKVLLRNAVHDYLCSEKDEFVEQRKSYGDMSGLTAASFVGLATAYVVPLVPLVPAFVIPAVAVLICCAARIGKSAFCARMTELRVLDTPPDSEGKQIAGTADNK